MGGIDQSVKALAIAGVQPSDAAVLDGTYKISRPFLYLTKGDPQGVVKVFSDFVLSPEGQAIVSQKFVKIK